MIQTMKNIMIPALIACVAFASSVATLQTSVDAATSRPVATITPKPNETAQSAIRTIATIAPKANAVTTKAPRVSATIAPKANAVTTKAPRVNATIAPKANAVTTKAPRVNATIAPKANAVTTKAPRANAIQTPRPNVTQVPTTATPVSTTNATATPTVTPTATPIATIHPTSVSILENELITAVNQTVTATAQVLPSNATNKNVVWTIANPSIATVNSSGTITGLSVGTTTVTATTQVGGHVSTKTVRVVQEISKEIEIGYATQAMKDADSSLGRYVIGGGPWVCMNVNETINDLQSITSESSDVAIYMGTGCGTIYASIENVLTSSATQAKYALLKATTNTNGTTQESFIKAKLLPFIPLTGFSIVEDSVTTAITGYQAIQVLFYPANATNKNLIFSYSNSGVANVYKNYDGSYLVSGAVNEHEYANSPIPAGSTVVQVSTEDGGFTDSITVTTTTPPQITNTITLTNQSGSNVLDWNDGEVNESGVTKKYEIYFKYQENGSNFMSQLCSTDSNVNISIGFNSSDCGGLIIESGKTYEVYVKTDFHYANPSWTTYVSYQIKTSNSIFVTFN